MGRAVAITTPAAGQVLTPRSAVARRSAREVRIRGQAFRSLFAAISSLLSPEQVTQVVARLEPEVQALWPGAVQATGWYSLAWYKQLQQAACAVSGQADFAHRLGREARRLDARGVYRFILRFASPEALIRNASSVLALYLEGPVVRTGPVVRGVSSCSIGFELDCADGFDAGLWDELLGSLEQIFELAGATGVAARALDHEPGWLRGEVVWLLPSA